MRRLFLIAALALAAAAVTAPIALAGSPHFVSNTLSAVVSGTNGDTLTVSGKEAGLGDEDQIHIVVTATASCINPGGKHPKAENKQSVSGEGDFPVQNGKAEFEITVTADLQPNCSPPMTIQWSDITVTDTTNGISKTF